MGPPVQLAAFLGVASPESARLYQRDQVPRRSDGFIDPAPRAMTPALQPILADFGGKSFQVSPIDVLKALISLRRHDMQYIKTDVGRILHGRQLTRADLRQRGAVAEEDEDDAAAENEVYSRLLDIPMDEDAEPPALGTPTSEHAPTPPALPANFDLPVPMDEGSKANVDQFGSENVSPAMSEPPALPSVKTEPDFPVPPPTEDEPGLLTPPPEVKAEEDAQAPADAADQDAEGRIAQLLVWSL
jgi:hypothetical protein